MNTFLDLETKTAGSLFNWNNKTVALTDHKAQKITIDWSRDESGRWNWRTKEAICICAWQLYVSQDEGVATRSVTW